MKMHSDPRTQFRININTEISKWIHKVEQIILRVDWNIELLEIKTWMETQGLTAGDGKELGQSNAREWRRPVPPTLHAKMTPG